MKVIPLCISNKTSDGFLLLFLAHRVILITVVEFYFLFDKLFVMLALFKIITCICKNLANAAMAGYGCFHGCFSTITEMTASIRCSVGTWEGDPLYGPHRTVALRSFPTTAN